MNKIEAIINISLEYFDITFERFMKKSRKGKLPEKRFVAMWLGKKYTNLSLGEIGANIGGKDHCTVLYGIGKVNKLMSIGDSFICNAIKALEPAVKEKMEALELEEMDGKSFLDVYIEYMLDRASDYGAERVYC